MQVSGFGNVLIDPLWHIICEYNVSFKGLLDLFLMCRIER